MLPNLNYLEDRPVYDYERILVDAWKEGGKEAEEKARDQYKEKKEADRKGRQDFARHYETIGRAERKSVMAKMLGELKGKQDELLQKRNELKAKHDEMHVLNQMKPVTLMEVRKIDK